MAKKARKPRSFVFYAIVLLVLELRPILAWCFPSRSGRRQACHGVATLSLSRRGGDSNAQQQQHKALTTQFPHNGSPYLAVITEPDACDSQETLQRTLHALTQAVSTDQVDLISIRQALPNPAKQQRDEIANRLVQLAQQLVNLSRRHCFCLVISSDWIDVVERVPGVKGIHVKESHRHQIPALRVLHNDALIIGTSAHSIESALDAWHKYQPDYFFVGTCYSTQSHPEKSPHDLEGPALPGQVAAALQDKMRNHDSSKQQCCPPVLAIGGINSENCRDPVQVFGADGVAAIRAVLQAPNPARTVQQMKQNMNAAAL